MHFSKYIFSFSAGILILFSCSSGSEINSHNEPDKTDSLDNQKDSIKEIYIDDLNFDLVIQAIYGKDTSLEVYNYVSYDGIVHIDTLVKGKTRTPGYEEESDFEEFTFMTPLLDVSYTENNAEKAAFLFIGDYMYQHGHTWSYVEVFFFEKNNEKWRFIDSLSFESFDIENIEEVNLSKNGFVIRSTGVWANMGGGFGAAEFLVYQ